jgi:hypothetical protein
MTDPAERAPAEPVAVLDLHDAVGIVLERYVGDADPLQLNTDGNVQRAGQLGSPQPPPRPPDHARLPCRWAGF